ncbi:histidine kinase [Streptomyces sp. P1-3]|uniref:sensor histidine kinase n=1 Tax=Streptomyces sp. P1-3 TaxID=3421658 RepID=UPI003D35EC5D
MDGSGTATTIDGGPAASAEQRGPRRTARDWAVDLACCTAAVAFSVATSGPIDRDPAVSDNQLFADLMVGGVLGCAALWLRRRHPVGLAAALLPVSAVSHFVIGPLLVALFTVAVHRPPRTTAFVGAGAMAFSLIGGLLHDDPELDFAASTLFGAVIYGCVIGWGLFVRSRRQLLESLRERARRAEAEAALRAEQAQRLTRERIAREMHDVLAHRLSLLSVHAGALEYRADASPDEVAQAAGVIRSSAHAALQDLREVIGVLRAPYGEPADGAPERPQPTLADLPRLVTESRQAGMRVTLRKAPDGEGPPAVPGGTARTAYRIVQEGLTNARKHAPGAEVTVTVTGAPGEGLRVEVRNPLPAADSAPAAPAPAAPDAAQPGTATAPGAAQPGTPAAPGAAQPGTPAAPGAAQPGTPAAPGAAQPGTATGHHATARRSQGAGGAPAMAIPGAGAGLAGLAERATLAGGQLECGHASDGGFRLHAWLPWPA